MPSIAFYVVLEKKIVKLINAVHGPDPAQLHFYQAEQWEGTHGQLVEKVRGESTIIAEMVVI